MALSPRRRRVARFVARWRTEYAVASLLLYLFVILPVSVWLFPDSNIWLALLLVLIGILDALKDLADQLADEGDDDA
jgi:hypothetical protein